MGKTSKTISISYNPQKDQELLDLWQWLKDHCQKEQIPVKEGLLRALRKYKSEVIMMEALREAIPKAVKLVQTTNANQDKSQ